MGFFKKAEIDKNYDIEKSQLGSGNFAVVKLATYKGPEKSGVPLKKGDKVAVKQIDKAKVEDMNDITREIEIMQNTKHPNVITLFEIYDEPKRMSLVMELVTGGELFDRIVAKSQYTEKEAADCMKQLCTALAYLHGQNVVHRDLKPENILLRNLQSPAIKIIDFGSACYEQQMPTSSYIQSRFYRSPEVLLGCPYSTSIDMWSLGCILVEMHTGEPLFSGQDEADQVSKIYELLGPPPAHMVQSGTKGQKYFRAARDGSFVLRDAARSTPRRSLDDVLGVEIGGPEGRRMDEPGHSVSDYLRLKDLIMMMLAYDPKHRITPFQAISHSFFGMTDLEVQTEAPGSSGASGRGGGSRAG
mmetsp:Transcript_5989/g.18034  ORF Transcript_5989/g.18034 Transcript_5989/m.18034 type:complete len:358 (-) Transcript_5989:366-1439(-)